MGQYVCVGIQNKVRVPKSGLDKFKDEYSHEELLEYFEMTHLLFDAFERTETEDAYVYQLKDELVEHELLPFLKEFYPLRYQEKEYYEDALEAVEECKNLDELKEMMELSYDDYDEAFQIIDGSSLSFLTSDDFDNRCFSYSFQNVSLSIDGKILMESYGSFLGFVRRSLCEVFKKIQAHHCHQSLDRWIGQRGGQKEQARDRGEMCPFLLLVFLYVLALRNYGKA